MPHRKYYPHVTGPPQTSELPWVWPAGHPMPEYARPTYGMGGSPSAFESVPFPLTRSIDLGHLMNQLKGLLGGKEEEPKDNRFSYEDYLMNELVKSFHTGSFAEDPRGLHLPPPSERDYGPPMVQFPYSRYTQNEDFYRDPYKRKHTEEFSQRMSGFQKGEPSRRDINEDFTWRSEPHEVYPPQWSDPIMQPRALMIKLDTGAYGEKTPQELKEIVDVMEMLRAGHQLTGEPPYKR